MKTEIQLNKPINHIAFIMDGNGRWAKARGLARHFGHKEACNRLIDIFTYCKDYGIQVASFYAFSTENWKRPKDEIDHLFDYLCEFFEREMPRIQKDGIRIIVSGDYSRLPEKARNKTAQAIEETKNNKEFTANICLNYGGKEEILRATRSIAEEVKEGKLNVDLIDDKVFEDHLYTKGLPPVDLLIRTSGEMRTSNFLPWQLAYAEFVFTKVHWPDFKRKEFVECLEEYNKRNRRYGGLENGK